MIAQQLERRRVIERGETERWRYTDVMLFIECVFRVEAGQHDFPVAVQARPSASFGAVASP
jgi:hypothetical protein